MAGESGTEAPSRNEKPERTPAHPPGPGGLPLLGSLFDARRDPLGFAMKLTRKYGDLVHFRIGYYTGYLLNHPDYADHVLHRNHGNYDKQNYNYRMLKPVLGEGLITADGEQWRRHRRLIQPAFQRKQIAAFAGVAVRAAKAMLERWKFAARQERPVDADAEMMRLTLRVITESLFGDRIPDAAEIVRRAFTVLNRDIAYRFRTVFVPPLWIPTPRNRAFKQARAELDRLVYEIIERRRKSGERQDDLLGTLLTAGSGEPEKKQGLTDREIRDEVMTLLLAGHETTANLLTWSCHLLSRHPEAAERVRTESREALGSRDPEFDDLPALSYTKMVLQESMRLYPPVWIISRRAVGDDRIGGYAIPAGSTVTICPYTLHRHPDFWDRPEAFRPERFSPGMEKERHPRAYLPFGGGPRSCVGQHFAMMEAALILAMIARRYRLEPVEGQPVEPEPLVTLRPRNGVQLRLESA